MTFSFTDNRLDAIAAKVDAGQRLGVDDGLILYDTHDLLGLGRLADGVRRNRHGDRAFFVYNQHLNYTNICRNRCRFCAYARDKDEPASFTFTREEVRKALTDRIDEPIREIHMVGGLNPALGFDYYLDLLRIIREVRPEATIKAFKAAGVSVKTMVGGAPVTEAFAKQIGADGYSDDAPGAVELARKLAAA